MAESRTIDLREYEEGDEIEGEVSSGVMVYRILKTSADEFIARIVSSKGKKRKYHGKEFYPQMISSF